MPTALAIGYGAIFAALSILRHVTFRTQTWDLGIFEQSFWNTLQGNVMYNVFENANHLSVHFSPFLFTLVPIYAIAPGPTILLILQSLAVGGGAIPLYAMTRRWTNAGTAIVVACAYLLYPPLHWLTLFDFHEVAFAIPLFLVAFDQLDRGRWAVSATALGLAASTAENMILATAGVGLYIMITSRRHRRFGVWVLAGAAAYFVFTAAVLMPTLGGKIYRLDRYANLGQTPAEMLSTITQRPHRLLATIATPEKFAYLARLFAPLASLPLLAPTSLILLLPGMAQNLLTDYAPQFQNTYQYDAILIAFLFIGCALGWKKIGQRWSAALPALRWIGLGAAVAAFLWWSPLGLRHYPWMQFRPDDRSKALSAIVRALPADASIAAATNLVPHLTHRTDIWMAGTESIANPDIIILDLWDTTGFSSAENFQNYLASYQQKKYRSRLLEQRFLILTRTDAF